MGNFVVQKVVSTNALILFLTLLCIVAVLIRDYARHILGRERKHFRQQVVVIEVLEVVDLIDGGNVVRGYILDLLHHLLVLEVLGPEHAIVVLCCRVSRRLVFNFSEVCHILQCKSGPLDKVV